MKHTSIFSQVLDLVTFTTCSLILSILFNGIILLIAAFILGAMAYRSYSKYLKATEQETISLEQIVYPAKVKVELCANYIKGKALNVRDHVCYYTNKMKHAIYMQKVYFLQLLPQKLGLSGWQVVYNPDPNIYQMLPVQSNFVF